MPYRRFRDAFRSSPVASPEGRSIKTGRRRGVLASIFTAAVACCCSQCHAMGIETQRDPSSVQVLAGSDCSLVTDLWRSQFLVSSEVNQGSADSENGQGSAAARTVGTSAHAFGSEEIALGTQADLPIPTETDPFETVGVNSESLTMTDWESAESNAVGSKGKTFTKDGPSVVTAIVGVVGLIVVSGAYLRGKK